jgi:hypothetical protein
MVIRRLQCTLAVPYRSCGHGSAWIEELTSRVTGILGCCAGKKLGPTFSFLFSRTVRMIRTELRHFSPFFVTSRTASLRKFIQASHPCPPRRNMVIGKRGSEFLESFCRMVRKEDILNRQYDLLAIKRVHVSCCGWRRGIWRWQVYMSLRWESRHFCNDQDLCLFTGLLQDKLADTQSKAFQLKVGKRR